MSIRYQFEVIRLIKNFFNNNHFLEVLTPPGVQNPGMETHIHPYQLYSVQKKKNIPLYLHTSPEFLMKKILASESADLDKIYQISYVFRDEPDSPIHRNQFIMLEWYRKNEHYQKIMSDVENLIKFILIEGKKLNLPIKENMKQVRLVKKSMQEIFLEFIDVDILNFLDVDSIKNLLKTFPEVPTPNVDLEWDDYFFLLYLNKIEPLLTKYPLLLIYEFPSPLSALSTIKEDDSRVCERFEVYINGIELCNCFNELTDIQELEKRFSSQNELKKTTYGYDLPSPEEFYSVMRKGYPKSSGIALGIERIIKSLFEIENPFFN